MGIRRFAGFFSRIATKLFIRGKKPICSHSINELNGKYCIVDIFPKLYSGIIHVRSKGRDILDKNGKIITHLHVILDYTLYLLKLGIVPIYVFDGKSPNIKTNVLEKRKKSKEKLKEILSKIPDEKKNIDNPDYIKAFKRNVNITKKQIEECKELIGLMGIPYVQAKEEADNESIKILHSMGDKIHSVISDDTDYLVFGAKKLICNFTQASMYAIEYNSEDIYSILLKKTNEIRKKICNLEPIKEFTHENFVKFMVILGSGYCDGVHSSNFDFLFEKFILCNFNMDDFINLIKNEKIKISSDFVKNWEKIVNYYCSIVDDTFYDIQFVKPNQLKLSSYLNKTLNLDDKNISTIYKNISIAHFMFSRISL